VRAGFRAFVEARLPADCRAEFTAHSSGQPIVMPTDNALFEAARTALGAEWETEAAFIGSGGSIPVVAQLKDMLGLDTLLVGFSLADDAIHSPNEKYDLASFEKGARAWARILPALASR
ncbi:MAG: M20/M25/M40 family metallo-hydrolase, partial [Pseudomonadota bacterium]